MAAEAPTVATEADHAADRPLAWSWPATALALLGWTVLTVVAWKLGQPHRDEWKLRAAPITGFFDRHLSPLTLVVLLLGLALARWLPGWCLRTGWRRLLLAVVLLGVAWGLALASMRGHESFDRGLANPEEYPAIVPVVDEVGVRQFIDTFTTEEVLRTYPVHIEGHPLGAALLFVGLDRIGLGGSSRAAGFLIVASSTAMVAVLLTVREVAGERRARRAAPFLVLFPGLVWWVTSADALFATVGAWGTALVVLASSPAAPPRRRAVLAALAGLTWGLAFHLSYGLVPLLLVGLAVVAVRRCWIVLLWAAAGGAVVTGAFVLAGFWWFDGLAATGIRYHDGIASVRSGSYFAFLGNPAAVGLALGPVAWVAVARVRDVSLSVLAYPAIAALLLADASGLSKAEVERIWLPFTPWVLVLAAGLVDRSGRRERWSWSPGWPALASWLLVGQVVLAVTVESSVRTPW